MFRSLDFSLTFVSVVFNYTGPFFLKYIPRFLSLSLPYILFRQILDLIDLKNPTPESRTRAYIYAFLAFVCSICKVWKSFVCFAAKPNQSLHALGSS